jgi:hypothetical protein
MRFIGSPNPGRRWAHRGAALAGSMALAVGGMLFAATEASATPTSCSNTPLAFEVGQNEMCAQVTAINSGSYLALHAQPNYSGGVAAGSPQYGNGDWFAVYCWTTGPGDADGHGDTYWFNVDDGNANIGWVNDWYLTTGSYAQWSSVIPHC